MSFLVLVIPSLSPVLLRGGKGESERLWLLARVNSAQPQCATFKQMLFKLAGLKAPTLPGRNMEKYAFFQIKICFAERVCQKQSADLKIFDILLY